MQAEGNAPASVAAALIEDVRKKYGGTDQEATYDTIAKNVAGVAYAGASPTFTF